MFPKPGSREAAIAAVLCCLFDMTPGGRGDLSITSKAGRLFSGQQGQTSKSTVSRLERTSFLIRGDCYFRSLVRLPSCSLVAKPAVTWEDLEGLIRCTGLLCGAAHGDASAGTGSFGG